MGSQPSSYRRDGENDQMLNNGEPKAANVTNRYMARVHSQQIDAQLRTEKQDSRTHVKCLLLGGAESGKTTIFKQMRILHLNGFTPADLNMYSLMIHSNVVVAVQQLLDACIKFRIVHESTIQRQIEEEYAQAKADQKITTASASSAGTSKRETRPEEGNNVAETTLSPMRSSPKARRRGELHTSDDLPPLRVSPAMQRRAQSSTSATSVRQTNVDSPRLVLVNRLKATMGEVISRIWNSTSVRMVYKRRHEFEIGENAAYFLNQIARLTDKSFSPTHADILHCRHRTTGIHEIAFKFLGMTLSLVDVGGQKSERRKWLHVFDNVTLVLFVSSMSAFCQQDCDDPEINRMVSSLQIYDSIVRTEHFKNTSFVLFLNKKDIFEEVLEHHKLTEAFPDYKGDNSYDDTLEFIIKKFARPLRRRRDQFFPFVTRATDTENMNRVFESAIAHIVSSNMKDAGLNLD